MINHLAAALIMLWALPTLADAQTFEDDYYTYEVISTSPAKAKIIGFSTKFNDILSTGYIQLEKWSLSYCNHTYEGVDYDVEQIGDLAFSPDNPLYDSWPEGKELCKKIINFNNTYSTITRIGDKAFMNCSNLADISIGVMAWPPKPMQYIGEHCFDGTALYRVYWSNAVDIPAYCFANTPDLKEFNFYETAAIGEGAFQNSGLETVEFPSTMKMIHSRAFDGCSLLKGFKCNDTDPQDINDDAFDGIPDGVALIVPDGTEALYKARTGWNHFGDLIQHFTMVGQTVSDDYFTYQIYEDDSDGLPGKCTITGLAPGCTKTMFYAYNTPTGPQIVDPVGYTHYYTATEIAERAFRGEDISWMDLSGFSIQSIGRLAFSKCTSLYHIDLPANLQYIGESGFEGCTALTYLSLPTSVNALGERVFAQTGLHQIVDNGTINYISAEAYAECPNLKDVTIPTTIGWIAEGAFSESAIQSVVLPLELANNIGAYAFADCKSLKKVVGLHDNPGDIPNTVFKGVADGAVLFVPEGAADNYNAFLGWTDYLTLKEARDMTDEVIEIGDFKYRVTYFELTGDAMNRQLQLLGVAKGKSPTAVDIPAVLLYDDMDYSLQSVGEEAFQNNGNITRADFSEAVTLNDIGEYAFSGCANLKEVLLYKDYSSDAQLYCIQEGAFKASGLEGINLPESLSTIGSEAFKDCQHLATLGMSACYNLSEIGPEAFMGTTALESLWLPYSSYMFVFDRAFAGSGIKSLYFPYCIDVNTFTDEVFKDCANLKNVYTEIDDPNEFGGVDTFAGIHPGAILWVPEGKVDTYKALSTWVPFADVRENQLTPTAIDSPTVGQPVSPTAVYDLQGRRVGSSNMAAGLYIFNGRKVVVK